MKPHTLIPARAALAAALLACSCAAHADPKDFRTATWNLQGASASTESKWNVNVRQLVSGAEAVDILAVQEAGQPPFNAVDTGRVLGRGTPVRELRWTLGTLRGASDPGTLFIYFADIDTGARRVNLALVSNRQADDVFVVPPSTTVSRPVLGIRIGNDAFLSGHALASGGPDAEAMVESVHDFFQNHPNPQWQATNWMLLADFNRPPGRLRAELEAPARNHTRVLDPGAPTQRQGNTLDYAVLGNAVGVIPDGLAASLTPSRRRTTQLSSDHFPVFFNPTGSGAQR
ncbi:cytolethal distending toxin subunit B family protein [Amphibiibacter pelophylacis]|uniref:Cytolethal distending toxin subunit B family protein n=1 Tax=Amphibiibacter pelophylacis TaxID=1799477 RepID=A0ACC6P315_9BURK